MTRIPRLLAALPLLLGACIPYATGTTAHPAPQGQVVPSTSIYFVPGGFERSTADSTLSSYFAMDAEARFGLDERSDLGIRAPGMIGIVVNYKRRLDAGAPGTGPAFAVMAGAGVVNAGEHAHVELSLLASGAQRESGAGVTPYGGVKAMHVFPMVEDAVRDDPTVGVFAGLRIGTDAIAISPEIAVFHDRSALRLRDRDWIIVPSFTLHGDELMRRLFGARPTSRPPPPGRPPLPWP